MQEDHFDAIVIGSGFGGAVMAYRLAEAGLRVCLLERGKAYAPGSFPRSPGDMQHNFWDPGAKLFGLFNIWSFHGLDAIVASGLGGGSLIYANVLLRKHPETFVRGDPHDPDAEDWPLSYIDLLPHYRAVEAVLKPRRYPFHQPPYSRTARTMMLHNAEKAEKRTYEWQAAPLGVTFAGDNGVSADFDKPLPPDPQNYHGPGTQRFPCTLCGECDLGCNQGSKNTLDHTYISMAAAKPTTSIRTLCEVQEFAPHPRGYRVVYVQHENTNGTPAGTYAATATQLVLAAGTLGSNYLLLKNRAAFPQLSQRVGHRFCTNGDMIMFLTMKHDTPQAVSGIDAFQGPVITSTVRMARDTKDGRQREIHLQDASAPQFAYWMLFVPDLLRAIWIEQRQFLRLLWLQMRGQPDHDLGAEIASLFRHPRFSEGLLPLLAMGQDTPDGVVRLASGRRPKLTIDWRIKRSSRFFEHASAAGKKLAGDIKATFHDSLHRRFNRSFTVHPLGGCAMARSPEQGVVDAWGEVFNYPGFFIADGSVMPGPVGPNPGLTIAALADRFANRVIANHRAGRLHQRAGQTVRLDEQPPASPVQLRFSERMVGFIGHGDQPFAQGYIAGRANELALEMRLKIRIANLTAFLADSEHSAVASGVVYCKALGGALRIERGNFNLFVDCGSPSEKEMRYCLLLRDAQGQRRTLYGVKSLPNATPLADITTLFTQVLDGHWQAPDPRAEVLFSGILHIDTPGIVRLLASLRADAPAAGQRWRALLRFAALYTRSLWQVYGHMPAQPPAARHRAKADVRRA